MSPVPVPRMQQLFRASLQRQAWRARIACLALALLASPGAAFICKAPARLPASMTRTYVDTDRPHSEFLRDVDRRVEAARRRGARRAGRRRGRARHQRPTKRASACLSVSARNIPREYEVYYAVTFSLRVGTESLISNESLVVTRAYTYDETQVLAKAAEEQILRARARRGSRAARHAAHPGARRDARPCRRGRASRRVRVARASTRRRPSSCSPTLDRARGRRSCSRLRCAARRARAARARFRARTGATAEAGLVGNAVYVRARHAGALVPARALPLRLHGRRAPRGARDGCRRQRRRRERRLLSASVARANACAVSAPSVVLPTWMRGATAFAKARRARGSTATARHAREWLLAHALIDAQRQPIAKLR